MIFYFSGTGNSLYVARRLQQEQGHKLIDISKAVAGKQTEYSLDHNESVGLIFPVYYYGLPTIVVDFIKELKLLSEGQPYIFSVMTCGENGGAADRQLVKLLKDKGLSLSANHELPMVDNFIFGYDLMNSEDQQEALDKGEGRLRGIIKSVQVKGSSDKPSSVIDRILTAIAYPLYKNGRKTKKFYADDRCTSCNLCEEICPSKVIKMVEGRPVWNKEQCIHCVACINRCPEEAIQFGQATKKRIRYLHPILKQIEENI